MMISAVCLRLLDKPQDLNPMSLLYFINTLMTKIISLHLDLGTVFSTETVAIHAIHALNFNAN